MDILKLSSFAFVRAGAFLAVTAASMTVVARTASSGGRARSASVLARGSAMLGGRGGGGARS